MDGVGDRRRFTPIRYVSDEQTANLAEKVKLRGFDGVVVEAETRAVMAYSGVLRHMIPLFVTADFIDMPSLSGADLQEALDFMGVFEGSYTLNLNDTTKVKDQKDRDYEILLQEVQFAEFAKKFCTLKFDLKTIQRLHKTAHYLDIPSLLHLTSTLIREAPSRAFMELVSPWVDYDSLEAYRNEVAAF